MHHAFEIDDGCRALTFRAGHQKTNKLRRVKFQAPHNAGTRIGLMNVFEVIECGNLRSHVAAEALAERNHLWSWISVQCYATEACLM
jgi:hypothetical protein